MIKSMLLRNFKGFENQFIPFAPLTILTGLNGMGKSTVLQAGLLLRQSYQQGLLPKKGIALNGDLVQLGTGKAVFFEGSPGNQLGFNLDIDKSSASWRFKYDSGHDILSLENEELTSGDIYKESLFSDAFQYIQAERLGTRTSLDISEYWVRDHHQLGSRGEFTAYYLNLFSGQSIESGLLHPRSTENTLLRQVEAWMGEFSPGLIIKPQTYPDIDQAGVLFSFTRGRNTTNDNRPANSGFGLIYSLPVVVALLAPKSGSVVFLENPEAHIHPRGQSKIGNLIARAADSGIQVVVETHSDHVLNAVRLAVKQRIISPDAVKVYYFHRPMNEGEEIISPIEMSNPIIDSEGRIDNWPEGFFDEFENTLMDLL